MRRFFFTIHDAVELVLFALKDSKKFNGKILCANMKACKLIDIIKVWNENFGGSYKIIKGRKGDRVDEYLIGDNEIKYTKKFIKIKNLFLFNRF